MSAESQDRRGEADIHPSPRGGGPARRAGTEGVRGLATRRGVEVARGVGEGISPPRPAGGEPPEGGGSDAGAPTAARATGLGTGAPDLFGAPPHYVTDGSFEGWLCAVFDAYARAETPAGILPDGADLPLGPVYRVETVQEHAARVRAGLDARAPGTSDRFYRAFLSEAPGIEHTLFRLAADVFARGRAALADWRSADARAAERLAARTNREMHRMHAFVRFEEHAAPEGGLWRAVVRPVHHVLPLLTPHFAARYPTLRWAIADAGRALALVHTPAPERADGAPPTVLAPAGALADAEAADREAHVQRMWQTYIAAVNIPERRNLELQRRHVPKRYWADLTELRDRAA